MTSYKFKIVKVDKITLIQLEWDKNKAARYRFLSKWQRWLKGLDRRISAFGGIYKLGAWMNCFFYGGPEEAKTVIKPFLKIPGLTLRIIKYVDFIEAVDAIAATYGERTAFESAGRFVYKDFSEEELEHIIDIINDAPSDDESYFQVYSLGGAIRDVDARETAFFYRNARYIAAVSSDWEYPGEAAINEAWVRRGFEYVKKLTEGSYVNFPYRCLRNYEYSYFGGNVERLRRIKSEYDPDNVFSFPQGISVHGDASQQINIY